MASPWSDSQHLVLATAVVGGDVQVAVGALLDGPDPAVAALEFGQAELFLQRAVVVEPQREHALPLEDAEQHQPVVGAPLRAVEERASAGGDRLRTERPHGL